jgi:hypothetical protein
MYRLIQDIQDGKTELSREAVFKYATAWNRTLTSIAVTDDGSRHCCRADDRLQEIKLSLPEFYRFAPMCDSSASARVKQM